VIRKLTFRLVLIAIAWLALIVGASLSVHVVMLDVLSIPHPTTDQVPDWTRLLNEVGSVLAAGVFYRLARASLRTQSITTHWLFLWVLFTMLHEALFRNFIMSGVVSHDWFYCLVANLPEPLVMLMVSGLVVVAAERFEGIPFTALLVSIGATAHYVFRPGVAAAFQPVIAHFEYLDTGNIYNPPYNWHVNVPSYLTFFEPAASAFAIAGLVWAALPRKSFTRTVTFVLLIVTLKGSLLPLLIYSFYQPRPLGAALLSESQFFLEVLLMAVLTAASWQFGPFNAAWIRRAHQG